MFAKYVFSLLVVFATVLVSETSHADVVVRFTPSGPDTKVNVSGAINLMDWDEISAGPASGVTLASVQSTILSLDVQSDSYWRADDDFSPFGSAPEQGFLATPDPGFNVGFIDAATLNVLVLPDNYVSGGEIDIDHTFAGLTFSDFGLTVGDEWGVEFPVYDSGGNQTGATQRITFRATIVPEPASACCLPVLVLGIFYWTNSRRRK